MLPPPLRRLGLAFVEDYLLAGRTPDAGSVGEFRGHASHWASGPRDQFFHGTKVVFQGLPAAIRQVEIRAWYASVERFATADVPGLLESSGVDAQVPVGGPEEISQVIERHRLVDRQRAHYPKAQSFVDQAVKVRPWALVCRCGPHMVAVSVAPLPR